MSNIWIKKSMRAFKVGSQYVLYGLIVFMMIYPLWWLLSSMLKTSQEIMAIPPTFFPSYITFENLGVVFQRIDILGKMMINSFYVSITIPIFQTIIALFAGYAFARIKFKGRNLIFILFIGSMMIPPQLTMITNYITIANGLKLMNNLLSLQLLGMFSAFSIFMFRQRFLTIPQELEEAAKIDGCGTFGTFFRIALPLAKPVIYINLILSFNAIWGDFFVPMMFLRKKEVMTLPIGLTIIQGAYNTQSIGVMVAAIGMTTIPSILVYLIFRKQLVLGITSTGLKL